MASPRPHVPKFGNWQEEDNVPYTVCFEKARKGRKGDKIINPNDPEENPELFASKEPQVEPLSSQANEPIRKPPASPIHEHGTSRKDNELRQFAGSPHDSDFGRGVLSTDSADQHHKTVPPASGEIHRRPRRLSAESENSFEQSPFHPKAKVSGRGVGLPSPSHEGKSLHGSTLGTPGRSRMKQGSRPIDSPDRGAAVPRFGEWNENNPEAGDNYSQIFNKVREERQNADRNWAGTEAQPGASPYRYGVQRQSSEDNSKTCCFPWCRK